MLCNLHHDLLLRIHINNMAFVITTIPQVTTRYCFALLAIDHVVGVAFPYRYKNVIKLRVVYALIASVRIITAVLSFFHF